FLAATLGCQSAQKSTFVPPPAAQAPALTSNAAPIDKQNPPATATVIAQSQPNPEAAKALAADPVADLIARVEKEYLAGQENYRAGHLEAAKQNFDAAFNLLLESGSDLQSDDRLEA